MEGMKSQPKYFGEGEWSKRIFPYFKLQIRRTPGRGIPCISILSNSKVEKIFCIFFFLFVFEHQNISNFYIIAKQKQWTPIELTDSFPLSCWKGGIILLRDNAKSVRLCVCERVTAVAAERLGRF